mmetsp:Transcript_12139/g.36065  ORF Transcript_12139/g.36065 Transcript_12139/m.36065 type:complete len:220 (+) Transcript_12139:240-899(+)
MRESRSRSNPRRERASWNSEGSRKPSASVSILSKTTRSCVSERECRAWPCCSTPSRDLSTWDLSSSTREQSPTPFTTEPSCERITLMSPSSLSTRLWHWTSFGSSASATPPPELTLELRPVGTMMTWSMVATLPIMSETSWSTRPDQSSNSGASGSGGCHFLRPSLQPGSARAREFSGWFTTRRPSLKSVAPIFFPRVTTRITRQAQKSGFALEPHTSS